MESILNNLAIDLKEEKTFTKQYIRCIFCDYSKLLLRTWIEFSKKITKGIWDNWYMHFIIEEAIRGKTITCCITGG